MRSIPALLALALSLGCASHKLLVRAELEPANAGTLFVGVNVFDGEQALGARDVLVRNGVVEAVGEPGTLDAPGAVRIEGAGKTLMPGLVDAHGHLEGAGEAIWDAGLSPADFVDPARTFGRIAPGQRADLLLVTGDPTVDIAATEAIVAVFLDGRRITRARRE